MMPKGGMVHQAGFKRWAAARKAKRRQYHKGYGRQQRQSYANGAKRQSGQPANQPELPLHQY
jgi:hypothetical protein